MTVIIDRRGKEGRSQSNQQRFLQRHRKAVKKAVQRKVEETGLEEMADGKKKGIIIHSKGTEEPVFRHGKGGETERVFPGNERYVSGDRIKKPSEGSAGTGGSPDGESEDDFYLEISQRDFLDYVFEGLELPDMAKKTLLGDEEVEIRRAGYSSAGSTNRLDLCRSMARAIPRNFAMRESFKAQKRELEEKRDKLKGLLEGSSRELQEQIQKKLSHVEEEIDIVERQIEAIQYLDESDLRFKRFEEVPIPISKAVMFCKMDVSGSMTAWHKETAKRFFFLLYLFLKRQYDHVDIVFIRHAHYAKEVDEDEFFYSKESGGTIVSSAHEEMLRIIDERYSPSEWNIYGAHASDGDNWSEDSEKSFNILSKRVLPIVQYYTYVEVDRDEDSMLWDLYDVLDASFKNFAMARVTEQNDAYKVFRGLFEKEKQR